MSEPRELSAAETHAYILALVAAAFEGGAKPVLPPEATLAVSDVINAIGYADRLISAELKALPGKMSSDPAAQADYRRKLYAVMVEHEIKLADGQFQLTQGERAAPA